MATKALKFMTLRLSFLSIYILAFFSANCQDNEIIQLQENIKSFHAKIGQYKKHIKLLNDSVALAQEEIAKLKERKQLEQKPFYPTTTKAKVKLKSTPDDIDWLELLSKNDSIEVIDYSDGYFYVRYGNKYGFVYSMLVNYTDNLLLFKESKEREAREEMEQKSRIAAQKRKIAAQKSEEKKNAELDRIRAEQNRREVERRNYLMKKYETKTALKISDGEIWIGMTSQMAKDSRGEPQSINRTVTEWGTNEQWVYYNKYLYFENQILTSWQESNR